MEQLDAQGLERTVPVDADEVYEHVCDAWRRVLGQDREFRPDDDFFEIGGSSLLALRVVKSLSARLGMQIPLETPFRATTLLGLAAAVRQLRDQAAG